MIHIACAADGAYLPHAGTMMQSLFARQRDVIVHFLHGPTIGAQELAQLGAMCERAGGRLRAYRIDDETVAGLPTMDRIPRAMWYRLFLPELLREIPRVLYLDCDTLVMDDLTEIWNTDLQGAALAAVGNVFERQSANHACQLGLKQPGQYFNSGVLLLDLDAWRQARISNEVLDIARTRRLIWPDQDALNLALQGRWHSLHPRWNCQNSVFYFPHARDVFGATAVREAIVRPGILHFEGGELSKPWHYLCKHPQRDDYFRFRALTPWPAPPPEGRTMINVLLRPLPTPWIVRALRAQQRIQRALGSP